MGKEVKSMNNVKVRTKLIIVMLAAFLAMTACVVFSTESHSMKQGCIPEKRQKNWQQMRYVSSDMGMAAISGLISMMEPMLCCLAVRQKERIVWKQRMATVTKW